jgi:hypothetical protein
MIRYGDSKNKLLFIRAIAVILVFFNNLAGKTRVRNIPRIYIRIIHAVLKYHLVKPHKGIRLVPAVKEAIIWMNRSRMVIQRMKVIHK